MSRPNNHTALGAPIRWVRLRGEPFADWHVADRPTVRDDAVVLTALCGEILGEAEDVERAGFGVVVGNRCRTCLGMLLQVPD